MNNSMNQNKWRDIFIASVVSLGILILGANTFPIFMCLYLSPQIVVGYRHGMLNGGLSLLLTLGALAAYLGFQNIILIALFGIAGFCCLLEGVRKQKKPHETILMTTVLFAFILAGYFYILQASTSTDIFATSAADLEKLIEIYTTQLKQRLTSEQIEELKKMFEFGINYVKVALPGILGAISFFAAFLNYMVSTYMLRKMGIGRLETSRFKEFSLPKNFGIGILLTVLLTYIIGLVGFTYRDEVLLNLLVIYSFLLGIQGLAMQDYFLAKRRGMFTRIVFPIFMLIFFRAFILYSILGLADILFDFRLRSKNRGTGGLL